MGEGVEVGEGEGMTNAINWIGWFLIEAGDGLDMPVVTGWLYCLGSGLEAMG